MSAPNTLHLARGRHHQAEQHGDGRGLARAVAAEQRHRRGRRQREADMVHRRDGAIGLGQVTHRHGGAHSRRRRDASARSLLTLSRPWPCAARPLCRNYGSSARARLQVWPPQTIVKPAAARACPTGLRQGETRLRLQTIVRLRWLAVLGQSLTVIGAYWVLGIDLPIGWLPRRHRARRLGSMSRSASAIPRASA